MRKYLIAVVMTVPLAMSASAQVNPQQQRMTECNAQAKGMTGDARKNFMSTCLSGGSAGAQGPHCTKGKPCGNTCIAMGKECHIK